MNAEEAARDYTAKVQYLVDYLNGLDELCDGGFTFPDGEFWPATRPRENTLGAVANAERTKVR